MEDVNTNFLNLLVRPTRRGNRTDVYRLRGRRSNIPMRRLLSDERNASALTHLAPLIWTSR